LGDRFFKRNRYQLAALAWAAVIFTVSSIPGSKIPEVDIVDFDKLAHLGVYGCLGFLTYFAFRYQHRFPVLARLTFLSAILACSLYGATDEIHQLWVPGRTCDIWDWTADTVGGILGASLGMVVNLRYGHKLADPAPEKPE